MRISKRQYYNGYFIKNLNNSKLVWKEIKQIIWLNPKSTITPSKITDNKCEITDTKEIANAFCRYFANIGDQLSSTIPDVSTSPLDYLNKSTSDSFCIFPTT